MLAGAVGGQEGKRGARKGGGGDVVALGRGEGGRKGGKGRERKGGRTEHSELMATNVKWPRNEATTHLNACEIESIYGHVRHISESLLGSCRGVGTSADGL